MCGLRNLAFAALVAIAAPIVSLDPAGAGTIQVDPKGTVSFFGEVTQNDVPRLKAAIVEVKKSASSVQLWLDSPGGDVMAAIELGRFVRQNAIFTVVPGYEGARCYSACILIVMGGVRRLAVVNLGIHRPKFDEGHFAGLSESEARAEYQRLATEVDAYLAEMGADPSLFHQMMRVPSGKLRLLTPEEAEAFAINGVDPSYQEWTRAKRAQRLGLEKLQKLEACEQSQEYDDWTTAISRHVLECVESKTDSRTCAKDAAQRFPDPCASLRHRAQQ